MAGALGELSVLLSILRDKRMNVSNALAFERLHGQASPNRCSTLQSCVKREGADMIQELRPAQSSLSHSGGACGKQVAVLNTWERWQPLFCLNIEQSPSLLEPCKLNSVLHVSKQMA